MKSSVSYDDKLKFGQRLQEMMAAKYTTKTAVAQYCKISKTQLSHYCSGKRTPLPQTLLNMCMCLDCSPDWLTKGEGSINDKFDYKKHTSSNEMFLNRIRLEKEGESIGITFVLNKLEFNNFLTRAVQIMI